MPGAAPGSPPPLAGLSPTSRPHEQQALSHDAGPHRGHWSGCSSLPHAWPLAVTAGAVGPSLCGLSAPPPAPQSAFQILVPARRVSAPPFVLLPARACLSQAGRHPGEPRVRAPGRSRLCLCPGGPHCSSSPPIHWATAPGPQTSRSGGDPSSLPGEDPLSGLVPKAPFQALSVLLFLEDAELPAGSPDRES